MSEAGLVNTPWISGRSHPAVRLFASPGAGSISVLRSITPSSTPTFFEQVS